MTGNQEENRVREEGTATAEEKTENVFTSLGWPTRQPEGKRQQFTESASDKGNQEEDR